MSSVRECESPRKHLGDAVQGEEGGRQEDVVRVRNMAANEADYVCVVVGPGGHKPMPVLASTDT